MPDDTFIVNPLGISQSLVEEIKEPCIICGLGPSRFWARKDQYDTYKCLNCGFVYTYPVPSEDVLEGLYGSEYFEAYDPDREVKDEAYQKRLIQYEKDAAYAGGFVSSGKALDFGCGNGKYLEALSPAFEKSGFEFNPEAVRYLNTLGSGRFHTGDPFSMPIGDGTLDLVTMRGVIEHLPDPVGIAELLARKIKKGGYLVITATPNVDSPSATLYKERWNQFHPPAHLNYFSLRSLCLLWGRFGLVCVDAAMPYLDTPYAEPEADGRAWLEDLKAHYTGADPPNGSGPFVGNMLSAAFKKFEREKERALDGRQ